ncbi:flavin reductase family protein [bacterium]|nr:flavin reductase family protein [bacterium]
MLDKQKLAQALETLRSGIFVVTSQDAGKAAGCTAVWVTRASFNPPLLCVTLSPTRHTFSVLQAAGKFCINVLGESSLDVARRFGFNTGPESGKFDQVPSHLGENGMPILDNAVAWFECRVSQVLEVGDHRLVIGEVLASALQSNEAPAVYVAESFYSESQNQVRAGGGSGD